MRQRLVLVVSSAWRFASGARDWPISYELCSVSARDDYAGDHRLMVRDSRQRSR
jgi:hypothetical protein